jgi:hypothetical protein
MGKRSSADVGYLLAGPVDLTLLTNKLEYGGSIPVQDTTGFSMAAASFSQPGVKKYEITGHESWYDDDAYATASDLVTLASGSKIVMLAERGNTAGLTAVCAGGAIFAGLKTIMTVGEMHKAALELGVSGTIDNATIVAALATRAGDLTTEATYVDLGATGGGTTGGNAYMACTELDLDGSTDVVVTMEDSADHATWADHTVFTALTDVGAEMKVATDLTVNRYLAYKQAFTAPGAAPSAKATLAFKVNDPH